MQLICDITYPVHPILWEDVGRNVLHLLLLTLERRSCNSSLRVDEHVLASRYSFVQSAVPFEGHSKGALDLYAVSV